MVWYKKECLFTSPTPPPYSAAAWFNESAGGEKEKTREIVVQKKRGLLYHHYQITFIGPDTLGVCGGNKVTTKGTQGSWRQKVHRVQYKNKGLTTSVPHHLIQRPWQSESLGGGGREKKGKKFSNVPPPQKRGTYYMRSPPPSSAAATIREFGRGKNEGNSAPKKKRELLYAYTTTLVSSRDN